jgi:hypothetical protein
LEAPTEQRMVETIMAFNLEEMGISLIIDDGESYPAYRISVERMSAFLNCVMEDIEEEISFFLCRCCFE